LKKFIAEGKLSTIRTALWNEFHDRRKTSAQIMNFAKVTAKQVPGLWEPYEEKAFAREMIMDKSKWTPDYFDSQTTYLRTNFSKKRFSHLARVRQYLRDAKEDGFAPT